MSGWTHPEDSRSTGPMAERLSGVATTGDPGLGRARRGLRPQGPGRSSSLLWDRPGNDYILAIAGLIERRRGWHPPGRGGPGLTRSGYRGRQSASPGVWFGRCGGAAIGPLLPDPVWP